MKLHSHLDKKLIREAKEKMETKKIYSCMMIPILLMIVAIGVLPTISAAGYHQFRSQIQPTTSDCSQQQIYNINVTNDITSTGNTLGSVRIVIPTGFTVDNIIVIANNWTGTWSGGVVGNEILLQSGASGEDLPAGYGVWIFFLATAPSSGGVYEWTTTAYENRGWTGSPNDLLGPQPTVTVTCPTVETTTTTTTTETEISTTTETDTSTTTETEISTTTETDTSTTTETDTSTTTETETETSSITTTTTTTEFTELPPAEFSNVYVFVGATDTGIFGTKPPGTLFADFIDASAGTLLLGLADKGFMVWDNDATYVSQTTGQPTGAVPTDATRVTSGGPLVNGVCKYYEDSRMSPLYFGSFGIADTFYYGLFNNDTDTIIGVSQVDRSLIDVSYDMFVVQIFGEGAHKVVIVYGYSGRGTLAGALWFKDNLSYFENLPLGYAIVEWVDDGDGLPETPAIDAYNVLATTFPSFP